MAATINTEMAARLKEIARLLDEQGANQFRVRAYQRGKRRYTALFSNTALAHELGKTHDWVALYYDGGEGEKQCAVVTAKRGPLGGRRVVRGQETESAAFYNSQRGGG